jgi:hypothetical protein
VEASAPTDTVGAFRISEGESRSVDQDQIVQMIARLRAAQRRMEQSVQTPAEMYEYLRVYEDTVAGLLTEHRLMDYMHARMNLAEQYGG